MRSSANRPHHQIRQRDRDIQRPVGSRRHLSDPHRRLRHTGDILPASQEKPGQGVGIMPLHTDRATLHTAQGRYAAILRHFHGRGMQEPLHQPGRDPGGCHDLLATRPHERKHTCLLVTRQIRLHIPAHRFIGRFFDNVLADFLGSHRYHILTRGIAGLVFEDQVNQRTAARELDIVQMTVRCRLRHRLAKRIRISQDPVHETDRLNQIIEGKTRRTGNRFGQAHG